MMQKFTSESVTVRGSGTDIGGVCGNGGLSNAVCKNSTIEGTTSNSQNVGGVMGKCTWDNGYDYGSNNVVISKGMRCGRNNFQRRYLLHPLLP